MLIACSVGFVASLVAFGALFTRPDVVERQLHGAVVSLLKREVEARLGREVEAPQVASAIQQQLHGRIAAIQERVATAKLSALLVAHLCHYACGSPAERAGELRARAHEQIAQLEAGVIRTRQWAQSRYAAAIRELVVELRIFTGANALLLGLALLGALRSGAYRVAHVLSALLLASSALSAYLYVARQNWLMTLVFSDFVGWAYLGWVGVLFAVLSDCVFFQARVTQAIVNGVIGAVAGH